MTERPVFGCGSAAPQCGKALPYRDLCFLDSRGYASHRRPSLN